MGDQSTFATGAFFFFFKGNVSSENEPEQVLIIFGDVFLIFHVKK